MQQTKNDQWTNLRSGYLGVWIEAFLTDRRAQNLARGTIYFYAKKLALFDRYCGGRAISKVEQLTAEDLRLYLLWLQQDHNAGGVFDCCQAVDPEHVRGETIPAGPELSSGEIGALVAACQKDKRPAGARDAAIIALLYAARLRRAEITALDLTDFDPSGKLLIRGKRNKQRTAYIDNGALDALTDWLSARGAKAGPWFLAISKGGNSRERRLSNQSMYDMLARRGAEAGAEEFSPDDFRRTFIGDLLDKGADIATVSKMAGHGSGTTTTGYARRPEEAKQKAARLLHVPSRKRCGQ